MSYRSIFVALATAVMLASCSESSVPGRGAVMSGASLGSAIADKAKAGIIHRFSGSDGLKPVGDALVDNRGVIYGTASAGGPAKDGTLFRLTPNGEQYTFQVLHSFRGPDGAAPLAGLVARNNVLYGTTSEGGAHDSGTIFKIAKSGSGFKTIYSFMGGDDGAHPKSTLIWYKGELYGTTYRGGGACHLGRGCGTVFRVTPDGAEQTLYGFKGMRDGTLLTSGVLIGSDGTIFGTTFSGGLQTHRPSDCPAATGSHGCGTVFSLKPKGSTYTKNTIWVFTQDTVVDGNFPNSTLIAGPNHTLYGATEYGGGVGQFFGGIVYQMTPLRSGYSETILLDPQKSHVGNDLTGSLAYNNGALYGTARTDGSSCCGSVYKVVGSGGVVEHAFTGGEDGANPYGGVTLFGNSLFGTTEAGGGCSTMRTGCGTVYKIAIK